MGRAGSAIALLTTVLACFPGAERSWAADREELRCLALNIYWEARAEPLEDRWAIAHVTLNRVASPDFPDSICAVVQQGGEQSLGGCQFSWWCDGRSDTPFEDEAWREARRLARRALTAPLPDPTGGALFFHNDSIEPAWAGEKQRLRQIGAHIYYR
ncbi:MAG: cell wall hydrolase [Kiloniellales bacterium]